MSKTAAALAVLLPLVAATGCWRLGEPRTDAARVTWAAYPETVLVGETFSLEYAGPVADNSCGHLDTTGVTLTDSALVLSARRRVFDEALCADQRVSFYDARPFRVEEAGSYPVRSEDGRDLGRLVAVDSGAFTPMTTVGEGTLASAGGCTLFGPGWASNQRPFALRGLGPDLSGIVDTDSVVRIRGRLSGFSLCGVFGSRPTILLDSVFRTGRTGEDWYGGG